MSYNIQEAIERADEMIAGIRLAQEIVATLGGLGLRGGWFIHSNSITLEPPASADIADLIGRLPAEWRFHRTIQFDDGSYGLFWLINRDLNFGLYLGDVLAGDSRPEEE